MVTVIMIIMQYLDDMILEREKANDALREELTKYVGWCQMLDQSQVMIINHMLDQSQVMIIYQMLDQSQVMISVS